MEAASRELPELAKWAYADRGDAGCDFVGRYGWGMMASISLLPRTFTVRQMTVVGLSTRPCAWLGSPRRRL